MSQHLFQGLHAGGVVAAIEQSHVLNFGLLLPLPERAARISRIAQTCPTTQLPGHASLETATRASAAMREGWIGPTVDAILRAVATGLTSAAVPHVPLRALRLVLTAAILQCR